MADPAVDLSRSACLEADASQPVLDWRLSVNEFIRTFPQSFPVFMDYGVDTCCGGSMSVADAVKAYSIPDVELRRAIRQAIRVGGQ